MSTASYAASFALTGNGVIAAFTADQLLAVDRLYLAGSLADAQGVAILLKRCTGWPTGGVELSPQVIPCSWNTKQPALKATTTRFYSTAATPVGNLGNVFSGIGVWGAKNTPGTDTIHFEFDRTRPVRMRTGEFMVIEFGTAGLSPEISINLVLMGVA